MGSDTQLPTIGSDRNITATAEGRMQANAAGHGRLRCMCCAWPYHKTGDRRQRRASTQSTAPTASSMPFAVRHLVSAPIRADHLSKNTRGQHHASWAALLRDRRRSRKRVAYTATTHWAPLKGTNQ